MFATYRNPQTAAKEAPSSQHLAMNQISSKEQGLEGSEKLVKLARNNRHWVCVFSRADKNHYIKASHLLFKVHGDPALGQKFFNKTQKLSQGLFMKVQYA